METRTRTQPNRNRPTGDTERSETLLERWESWVLRWVELRESVDSEWSAASEALSGRGTEPIRKWLGWALYRIAARVNPEIRD